MSLLTATRPPARRRPFGALLVRLTTFGALFFAVKAVYRASEGKWPLFFFDVFATLFFASQAIVEWRRDRAAPAAPGGPHG